MEELHLSPQYIAGLFDGEGWFSIDLVKSGRSKNGRGSHVARAALAMREEYLLRALQTKYGGAINLHAARSITHSHSYRWTLSGSDRLVVFIEDVRPYLIAKRNAAEIVLALQKMKLSNTKYAPVSDDEWEDREALRFLLKRYNEKGVGKRVVEQLVAEEMPTTIDAFRENRRVAP